MSRAIADMTSKHKMIATLTVLLAFFMDLLDSTVVNIAIPSIQTHLGASYSAVQWIIAGYMLAFAVVLITAGRLGDIFGYKKLFLIGVACFTVASALSGAAVNPAMLIISRLLQGASAAIMAPQILSTIQVLFQDQKERAKISGLYGALGGLAATVGPIIGALLIDANLWHLEWRSIFYVNIPIGIFALFAGWRTLPNAKSPHPLKIDLKGVGLVSVALGLLVFPLVQGRDLGWPLWTFIMMAGSILLLALFGRYQVLKDRKDGSPLVVPQLFKRRTFVAGLLITLLFFAAMDAYFLVYTLFLQEGLGISVLRAGLSGIPFSLGVAVGAGAIGQPLAQKIGRLSMTLGMLTIAAGISLTLCVAHHYGADVHIWQFIPSFFISGTGMGLVFAPMFAFILAGVEVRHAGSASGIINTMQQVGGAIGIAAMGVIFFGALSGQAAKSAASYEPQIHRQLTAQHIPAPAQTRIVAGFEQCFTDRTTEKDASKLPKSCQSTGVANPAVSQLLAQTGKQANSYNFLLSVQRTLLCVVAGLVAAAALTFLLPAYIPKQAFDDFVG